MSQVSLKYFLENNINANQFEIRINICHQLVLFFIELITYNQLWYNILNALDNDEIIIDTTTLVIYVIQTGYSGNISSLDYVQLLSKTYEGNLFSLCMLCNNIILYPNIYYSMAIEYSASSIIPIAMPLEELPLTLQLIIKSPLLCILQNNYNNIDHFRSIIYQLAIDTPLKSIINAFDEYAIYRTTDTELDTAIMKLHI